MNKKPGLKPDDLIKSNIKDGEIELTEKELRQVAGGDFIKLGDIKGESLDDKHKGSLHIESFRTKP